MGKKCDAIIDIKEKTSEKKDFKLTNQGVIVLTVLIKLAVKKEKKHLSTLKSIKEMRFDFNVIKQICYSFWF
ncbi:hypothetical protein EAE92_07810 [Photorhabdus hainanensis]|nr:hypothetical protein [Photorhabdus hainanensis]